MLITQESFSNSRQWHDCLQYLSRRIKEQSFNTWLKSTKGEPNGENQFKIAVPNQFVAEWIEGHYSELIEEALFEILGHRYEIVYAIASGHEDEQQTILGLESENNGNGGTAKTERTACEGDVSHQCNLNKRYDFDSLVVGDFNHFACAAAMAVADAPGLTRYNPLFIYGRTGLGKTHIVQAIGNQIVEHFPSKRIMYATSEKFTSDFIASISNRTISHFTRVYRDVDTLIIDDIQFLTGKESTQEQFFHTFNTLHHFGRQIVLTSDRSPKDIKGLEERLLSRFAWGLVTDLQAPDLENRTAILHKKVEAEGATIPENVIRFIADQVSTNIRELEGTLIRLLAYASITGIQVELDMAQKVLATTLSSRRPELTIDVIQKKVSQSFSIDLQMMKAKKKTSDVVLARQVAMYLSRSLTNSSLKVIGTAFGGRDHSTVIHACNLVSEKMSSDPLFRQKIDRIAASLLY
jgi:chromosomal replication initiator protein